MKNLFHSLSLYGSRLISMVCSFVTNIYLAKTLSVESFGIYNISLNLIFVFLIFTEWGQNLIGTREIAKLNDPFQKRNIINEIISFKTIMAFVMIIVYLVVIFVFYRQFFLVLSLACIQLVVSPFIMDWYFQAERKFGFISFRQVFVAASALGLTIWLVNKPDQSWLSVLLYHATIFIGTILTLTFFIWNYSNIRIKLDAPLFFNRIKNSGVYFFSVIITSINYSLGPLILGLVNTPAEAAVYSSYYRIFASIVAPALITYNIFLPLLTSNNSHETRKRYIFLLSSCALLIVFGAIFLGKDIYQILYSTKYPFNQTIFIVFVTLIVVHFLNYYFVYLLIASHADRQFFVCFVLGLFVDVVFLATYFVVGKLSAQVIAEGLLISEIVALFTGMYFIYTRNLALQLGVIGRSVIVFALSMGFALLVHLYITNSVMIMIGCGGVCYLLLALLHFRLSSISAK
jgi:PST family polysaccharide transporter